MPVVPFSRIAPAPVVEERPSQMATLLAIANMHSEGMFDEPKDPTDAAPAGTAPAPKPTDVR